MGLFSQKKPGLYLGSTEKKGVCAQIGFHDKIPGSSFSEESTPSPFSLYTIKGSKDATKPQYFESKSILPGFLVEKNNSPVGNHAHKII